MAPSPDYNPFLQFAPTFKWGGRTWGANDQAAFLKYLKAHGHKNPQRWIRNHPVASKVFSPQDQLLYSYMHPQFTALQAAQRQQQDFYRRQLVDTAGFMHQLMGTLGEISPQIREAYMQGSNAMGALGTGYGDVLNQQGAANAAAGNQTLENIGAPEGQMLQGGDAGGVLAGLAGWIPQTLLSQQGGAYADAAATLPASASLEAQIMAKNILEQAAQSNADYQAQLNDLITQVPSIRQQIMQDQQKMNLDLRKQKLDELESERDWYLKQAYLADRQNQTAQRDQYIALANQRQASIDMARQGMAPDGSLLPGYYRDKNGNILKNGTRYNAKGEVVNIGTKSGGDKPTPKEEKKTVAQIQDDIDSYIENQMMIENPNFGVNAPERIVDPNLTFEQAVKQLMDRFGNNVSTKAGRAALLRAIRTALRRHGKKKPLPNQAPGR